MSENRLFSQSILVSLSEFPQIPDTVSRYMYVPNMYILAYPLDFLAGLCLFVCVILNLSIESCERLG